MGLLSGIGGIVGGLISGLGGKRSGKKLDKRLRQIADAIRFDPYSLTTGLGSTTFDGGRGIFTPSPALAENIAELDALRKARLQELMGFDTDEFATKFFDALDRLQSRREADSFASLESRLFNRAGVHTGTAAQISDYRNRLDEARMLRALQAREAALQERAGIFQDFLSLLQGGVNLQGAGTDLLGLSGELGQADLAAKTARANVLTGGGAAKAAANAAFFQNIGTSIGGLGNIFGRFLERSNAAPIGGGLTARAPFAEYLDLPWMRGNG